MSIPLELVYGLVLLAAAAHALWNAVVKGSSDSLLMLSAIRVVGLTGGVFVALIVPAPSLSSVPWLAGGSLVLYAYYALMLNAYRVGDLSQVYPIARGLAPLVVIAVTALFALEPMAAASAAAAALISTGILSLSLSGRSAGFRAIAYALGTGLAIAGYTVLNGLGVRRSDSLLGYAAWLEICTGIGVLAFAGVRRRGRIGRFVRAQWRLGLVAGVLSAGGYFVALWAMTRAPMASVAALRESSVVFSVLLGTFMLREPFGFRRTLSAVTVLLGILVLGFA